MHITLVFSTNKAGRHSIGDAKLAMQKYGAMWGKAEGYEGHSYAIPTKDANIKNLDLHEIERSIQKFMRFAAEHSELEFHVTRMGCEDEHGYKDIKIAPMFRGAPKNCIFPKEWSRFLEPNASIQN